MKLGALPSTATLNIYTSKESKMAHEKKSRLLGMNFVTARNRLDRDLLFQFATQLGHKCYRCGGELTRDSFSVDHKENWSAADDPVKAFFALDNIAFSHIRCNTAERTKRVRNNDHGLYRYDRYGCRCNVCKTAKAESYTYDKDKRRARYVKYGT